MVEAALVIVILLICVTCFRMAGDIKAMFGHNAAKSQTVNQDRFSCNVEVTPGESEEEAETFVVKMRGRVEVPTEMHDTDVQVLIADITTNKERPEPVLSNVRQWQMEDSPVFCHITHNGRIPRRVAILSDWVVIATVGADALRFPRRGSRKLRFVTSIISRESGGELAYASSVIDYESTQTGYIDEKENSKKSECLCVQLAVAVGSEGDKVGEKTTEIIEKWIAGRGESCKSQTEKSESTERLSNILKESVDLYTSGKEFDIEAMCRYLSENATITDRYEMMKVCLEIVRTGGEAFSKQTSLLTQISEWLGIDKDKFRAMSQKIIPPGSEKQADMEFLLGIHKDMEIDQIRELLNNEYQKWNARVTHPDTSIQKQADFMLRIIAEARRKYVEVSATAGKAGK